MIRAMFLSLVITIPFLSLFMTNYPIIIMSNTTGVTSGSDTHFPPGEPEYAPSFSECRINLYVFLCSSLLTVGPINVIFLLAIVLSVLPRFMSHLGTFKLALFEILLTVTLSSIKLTLCVSTTRFWNNLHLVLS